MTAQSQAAVIANRENSPALLPPRHRDHKHPFPAIKMSAPRDPSPVPASWLSHPDTVTGKARTPSSSSSDSEATITEPSDQATDEWRRHVCSHAMDGTANATVSYCPVDPGNAEDGRWATNPLTPPPGVTEKEWIKRCIEADRREAEVQQEKGRLDGENKTASLKAPKQRTVPARQHPYQRNVTKRHKKNNAISRKAYKAADDITENNHIVNTHTANTDTGNAQPSNTQTYEFRTGTYTTEAGQQGGLTAEQRQALEEIEMMKQV